MITREGFDRYVEDWAKKGVPFMAYWWPRGYSMIRTGEWIEPAYIDTVTRKAVREHKKKVPQSVLNKWTRLRDQLRRKTYGTFVMVTFDGQNISIEEE